MPNIETEESDAMNESELHAALATSGWERVHQTQKRAEYSHRSGGLICYMRKEVVHPYIIVHPKNTDRVSGILVNEEIKAVKPNDLYLFGSNMRKFPEKLNNGLKPERYGIGLLPYTPAGISIITEHLLRKDHQSNTSSTPESGATVSTSTDLEIERKVLSRLKQGLFRSRVKEVWKGKCSVTQLKNESLLIASHIKPWKNSNSDEKIDGYNGLFLSPNFDKLFDAGFISFQGDGAILISPQLAEGDKSELGVESGLKLNFVPEQSNTYLDYHRNEVFRSYA